MIKPRDEALQWYFYFMQERMSIFWKRFHGEKPPFTNDPILETHKFTNVYRALDRVSQYMIKNVIYHESLSQQPLDILLRIIIFKIFNTITTREYIAENYGEVTVDSFDPQRLSALLSKKKSTDTIFSAAYIMTGSHSRYAQYASKHEKWLHMIKDELLDEWKLIFITQAKSLEEVFDIFSSCPMIWPFLAYQYAIDCNYSAVINFDENSFVVAWIGAQRWIKKCFTSAGEHSYEDHIRRIHENFHELQERYGYSNFQPLWNRLPTLIDLQNCFCETDKYLRVKLPWLNLWNTRIKQKFHEHTTKIDYYFPPKRHISLDK